jgi:uncharacterized membrane protein
MNSNPLFILSILCLNVFIGEKLATLPYIRHLSAALIIIILGAIEANLGLIPTASNAPPLYEGIFTYISPLAIFFLMLGIQLRSLKKAGVPMIACFFLGSFATMAGVLISIWFFNGRQSIGEQFFVIGGMYTGTYIGGSTNLNAVALHYGFMKDGTLYAAVNAVDNIIGGIWVVATIAIPQLMKRILPTKVQSTEASDEENDAAYTSENETISPTNLALLVAIGCGTIFISSQLQKLLPTIPSVIWLTSIALILAQLPFINRLKGGKTLGLFCVYLFLTVIGAYCDFKALQGIGSLAITLLMMVSLLMLIHGLIIFGVGYLFNQDWDILGIASQANVGGASTALACAKSLGRPDLSLAAILIGALGNATGTYWGIFMAEILKGYF